MTAVRIASTKWHAWVWIAIGFMAGFIVLALATQMAGAALPTDDDEPAMVYVSSSWDGVFYVGRYFGDEPLVNVGDQVEPGTIVGTIEGMRRFEQYAGISGTIVDVLVSDSEMVYMGQPLFKVALEREPETP